MAPIYLGNIIELIRRPVHVDPGETYTEIGIRSFGKGIFHKPPMLGSELGNKRVFSIEPADLIFSNVFAWEGAVAIASAHEAGLIGSHRFMTCRVDEEVADARYLYYYFIGEHGLDVIRKASPGSAGRNRTLGIKNFASQIIYLPDLAEQHRVAKFLDQAFERSREVLEARGHVRMLGRSILNSYLRDLPRQPLGVGLTPSSEEVQVLPEQKYKICGVHGFGRGIFGRGMIMGSETSYKKFHRLRENMLVMSRLKAFEGALAVVPVEFDGWCVSPEFPTYEVDQSRLSLNYLTRLCELKSFWRSLSDGSKGLGARRERVSAEKLLEVKVPFPAIDVQHKIAEALDRLADASDLADHQQDVLQALRPSLLNAAFSGQL